MIQFVLVIMVNTFALVDTCIMLSRGGTAEDLRHLELIADQVRQVWPPTSS